VAIQYNSLSDIGWSEPELMELSLVVQDSSVISYIRINMLRDVLDRLRANIYNFIQKYFFFLLWSGFILLFIIGVYIRCRFIHLYIGSWTNCQQTNHLESTRNILCLHSYNHSFSFIIIKICSWKLFDQNHHSFPVIVMQKADITLLLSLYVPDAIQLIMSCCSILVSQFSVPLVLGVIPINIKHRHLIEQMTY